MSKLCLLFFYAKTADYSDGESGYGIAGVVILFFCIWIVAKIFPSDDNDDNHKEREYFDNHSIHDTNWDQFDEPSLSYSNVNPKTPELQTPVDNRQIIYSEDRKILKTANGIESIDILDGVEEIEANAFRNCPELKYVKLPDTLIKIGFSAFGHSQIKSVRLPTNLKEIEPFAFFACERLESVDLTPNTNVIINGCFEYTGLKEVTIVR